MSAVSVLRRRSSSHSRSRKGAGGSASEDKFIAIGIDFGTTFCGVSWACSESPDDIFEIQEWPSHYHNHMREQQVPTQFDLRSGKWGYEITNDLDPIKWFKLLLLRPEDILRDEIRDSDHLSHARAQLAEPGAPNPTQVVAAYLKKLWRHTLAQLRTRVVLDSWPLRVGITVPAIWPHYAHSAMREAARLAGITAERDIGLTTLDLIQEPEAAALSILFERGGKPEIQVGESFIVCDAGGGTVDVISYTVESLRPFQVVEAATGDGSLAGAFRIDEAFEGHVQFKTKLKLKSLDQAEYNAFFSQEWELGAKRTFTGQPHTPKFFLNPPSKAFRRRDKVWGNDSFALSRMEMITFFNRSLTGIRTLVSDQARKVKSNTKHAPKKIFLVGGLGDSPYVHNRLQDEFQGIVLRPLRPWSAVARGAVVRLLRDKIATQMSLNPRQRSALEMMPDVTTRRSRYHYGIIISTEVDDLDDFDPRLDRVTIDPLGERVTNRMSWYLRKGDQVKKKRPVKFEYFEYGRSADDKCVFHIEHSASDVPPLRPDDSVLELCNIACDWDRPFEDWTPVGDPRKGWRRYDDLALAMRFEGEPKWTLTVGKNAQERDVKVEYL